MFVAYSRDRVYKDVGERRQLFLDDDVIAVVKNVTRRQHSPAKHAANPIMKRDRPWEVIPYFRSPTFNVIKDPADGLYKCWYEDYYDYFGYQPSAGIQGNRVYFARSKDGLSWEKPLLGKHFIDGHDTNTVFSYLPGEMASCNSVMFDPKEADPRRRFKTVYFRRRLDVNRPKWHPGGRHSGALCMAFSPDGVDWTPFQGNPLFAIWLGDVEILTYDALDDKYILYGRYGGRPGGPVYPSRPEGIWGTRRRVYRTESRDPLVWPEPQLIFDPDDADNLDDELYAFVPWRADEMHLGLMTVLHHVDNTVDMYLHLSRDGLTWKRLLDHRPFIPRGPEGSYDHLDVETPSQPLVVGDELWFYYGGTKVHHDWWLWGVGEGLDLPETRDPEIARNGHHLCLATLRLDGYVSLDATVREGWVETKPLFSSAPALYINGRCQPNGYIQVEVMDSWNNVWEEYSRDECQTFVGDSVRHKFAWAGRSMVSEIPGAVKLRFYLRNAELYGFQFGAA